MTRHDREGPIHRAIYSWLRVVLPGAVIYHPPSETRRPGRAGHVERAMNAVNGVIPGMPDLIVLCGAATGPLFFEVKAEGSYLSPAQKDMHRRLGVLGYRVAVVRSVEDAREALAEWGVRTREARA